MPSCLPPRYRLQDLIFALWGTLAFLGDLGSDVWSAVGYYQGGDTVLACLHFGLYVLSSSVLQLLSWGWFWVDRRDWAPEGAAASGEGTANGHIELNGMAEAGGCCVEKEDTACHRGAEPLLQANGDTASAEAGGCCVDAAVYVEKEDTACHRGAEPLLQANGDTASAEAGGCCVEKEDTACHRGAEPLLQANGDTALCDSDRAPGQDVPASPIPEPPPDDGVPAFITYFYTSRIWRWPSCLLVLHILQLGYPFRCLHSLEVGLAAYRSSESSSKFNLYQEYAYFLTHDISMMRLVETFLENTPQLIIVLYYIVVRETIHLFQYFMIALSFVCISWAILDYHQSLRLFLKDKAKLNILSSVIYFLWNFCLISSRVICITLFTVTFHWMTALHFIGVWLVFFLWAWLQKTDFMKSKFLEPFYRATVAGILYFSWFNIADGRTVYRCIVYHVFITIDSILLLFSWKFWSFPSILDKYECFIIGTVVLLTGLGLVIRLLYYKYVHPNVTKESKLCYDQTDGMIGEGTYRMFAPTVKNLSWTQNKRMVHLAQQIY